MNDTDICVLAMNMEREESDKKLFFKNERPDKISLEKENSP